MTSYGLLYGNPKRRKFFQFFDTAERRDFEAWGWRLVGFRVRCINPKPQEPVYYGA